MLIPIWTSGRERAISRVLQNIRSLDFLTPTDDLINVASFVAQASRYTAFWDANRNDWIDAPGEFSSIDHILLAPSLASKISWVNIPHDHNPLEVSDHYPVVVKLSFSTDPVAPVDTTGVRITSLLPNPSGNENQDESITLKNNSNQNVSLVGWKIRDLTGRYWQLDEIGTLAPGEEKVIKRNGKPMALNNSGDTVDLLDSSGTILQTVTYGRTDEDVLVTP